MLVTQSVETGHLVARLMSFAARTNGVDFQFLTNMDTQKVRHLKVYLFFCTSFRVSVELGSG